ncbi:endonuclease domain-containing protein [Demequina maris]|uniref:endonuclease domain-containing protein n=1 Tax=Demequina maris TaxID=1638982 RepID=UPI00078060D6|nr:DUF559 domain-containing protein [Demequina maris]
MDLLVGGRVAVELDGRDYHSDPRAFREDRRRDRALIAAGFIPLRFTYADVVYAPETVIADVTRAVEALARRS